MSRLYDALNSLERKAQRPASADVPPLRATPPTRRRYRWPAIAVLGLVLAGTAALTVVPRGRLSALPSSPPIQNTVRQPTETTVRQPTASVAALRERAREAAFLGSLQQAEELSRQIVTLAPADADAWTDLGVVLVRRAQTRRGIEAFERSIALNPNNAPAHRNLAIALDREGQATAAAVHYRAFLALAPQHPDRARVEARLTGVR
jgi:tetratricopeptide (TPR) repeat protein